MRDETPTRPGGLGDPSPLELFTDREVRDDIAPREGEDMVRPGAHIQRFWQCKQGTLGANAQGDFAVQWGVAPDFWIIFVSPDTNDFRDKFTVTEQGSDPVGILCGANTAGYPIRFVLPGKRTSLHFQGTPAACEYLIIAALGYQPEEFF